MELKFEISNIIASKFENWQILNESLSTALIGNFKQKLALKEHQLFPWDTTVGDKIIEEYSNDWEQKLRPQLLKFPEYVYVIVTAEEYEEKWFVLYGLSHELIPLLRELQYFEYAVVANPLVERILFDTHTSKIILLNLNL